MWLSPARMTRSWSLGHRSPRRRTRAGGQRFAGLPAAWVIACTTCRGCTTQVHPQRSSCSWTRHWTRSHASAMTSSRGRSPGSSGWRHRPKAARLAGVGRPRHRSHAPAAGVGIGLRRDLRQPHGWTDVVATGMGRGPLLLAGSAEPRLGTTGGRWPGSARRRRGAGTRRWLNATADSSALPASRSIAAARSASTCSGTSALPECATSRLRSMSQRRSSRSTPQWRSSRRPFSPAAPQHVGCCRPWRNVSVSPGGSGWPACFATSRRAPAPCSNTATSPGSSDPTSCPVADGRSRTWGRRVASTETSPTACRSSSSSTVGCSMTRPAPVTRTSTATPRPGRRPAHDPAVMGSGLRPPLLDG